MGTINTEAHARTYANRGDAGVYGVDVFRQAVEHDDDGKVLYREEAGAEWLPSTADDWDTDHADELLSANGWYRVGVWSVQWDERGDDGWMCTVERAER
jgi:hypothetical protein